MIALIMFHSHHYYLYTYIIDRHTIQHQFSSNKKNLWDNIIDWVPVARGVGGLGGGGPWT